MAVFSALTGGKAAKKAGKAEAEGQRDAISELRRQYDTTRRDFAPYRAAGVNALAALTGELGLGTTAPGVNEGGTVQGFRNWLSSNDGGIGVLNEIAADYSGNDLAGLRARIGAGNIDKKPQFMAALSRYEAENPAQERGQAPGQFVQGGGLEGIKRSDIEAEYAGIGKEFDERFASFDPRFESFNPRFEAIGRGEGFETSPDYTFRRDEGTRGIQQQAAARGRLGSGRTLKALTDYSSNLAKGEYGDWYTRAYGRLGDEYGRLGDAYGRTANDYTRKYGATTDKYGRYGDAFSRLSGIAGAGQQSNNALANVGGQLSQNIAGAYGNIGQAKAGAAIGGYNAMQQGVGNTIGLAALGSSFARPQNFLSIGG
jgi:hypothetical protein